MPADPAPVLRSLLLVPGDSASKLDEALRAGADAVIVDLEDAVAPSRKEAARRNAAIILREAGAQADRPRLFVRVNALDTGLIDEDLAAIMPAAPDGIVLPGCVGGPDVQQLGARLAVHEAEVGLPDGATRILPIAAETAAALFALGTFAGASRRLVALAWGAEDLSADLGAVANRDAAGSLSEPFRLARSLTLFGAAAAGVEALDGVYAALGDEAGLRAECEEAARDGFGGKLALHPAQVPVINDAFVPAPAALAWAQAIVEAFAGNPDGPAPWVEGRMVDRGHLRRAERLLRRASIAPPRAPRPPSVA